MLKLSRGSCCCMIFGKRFYGKGKSVFASPARKKEARQLALEHFDFFYKPIFRKSWPSIRLGLTSKLKTCAVVNNFAANSDQLVDHLMLSGAQNLVALLEEARSGEISKDETGTHADKFGGHSDAGTAFEEDPSQQAHASESDSRHEGSLNEFMPPTHFITREPISDLDENRNLQTIRARGQVGVVISDDIVYPKHLRAFAYTCGDLSSFDEPALEVNSDVRTHQLMDAAALFPVFALDVRPDDHVADLCAATGEKTLALLQTLIPLGSLTLNDVSPARMNILRHNLCTYIKEDDDVRRVIRLSRLDAYDFGIKHRNSFDKILVDAPNTEDRKNLRAGDKEDNLFRRSRMEERIRLPELQTEILASGIRALRKSGILVYTTSSMAPNQNDEIVEAALQSLRESEDENDRKIQCVVCDLKPMAQNFKAAGILRFWKTAIRYGQQSIPYLPNNYGPVYTCKIMRVE